MDMHIDDIRKEFTREEFIDRFCIKRLNVGGFFYKKKSGVCPSDVKGLHEDCNSVPNCYVCWLEAIKDIKFKDEIESEQPDYEIEHFSFDNDKMEVNVRLKVKSDENVKNLIEQISQWL